MTSELIKKKLATHICLLTPMGKAPLAPGTAGSVAGLLFAVLAWAGGFAVYLVATTIVVFAGTWAAAVYERTSRIHDDKRIVVDEAAGMMIVLAGWEEPTIPVLVLAFAAFRLLDILKPWPLSWIDRRIGGGLGVMADDIAAGVIGIAILELLRPFL